jgi:hypothetical protein
MPQRRAAPQSTAQQATRQTSRSAAWAACPGTRRQSSRGRRCRRAPATSTTARQWPYCGQGTRRAATAARLSCWRRQTCPAEGRAPGERGRVELCEREGWWRKMQGVNEGNFKSPQKAPEHQSTGTPSAAALLPARSQRSPCLCCGAARASLSVRVSRLALAVNFRLVFIRHTIAKHSAHASTARQIELRCVCLPTPVCAICGVAPGHLVSREAAWQLCARLVFLSAPLALALPLTPSPATRLPTPAQLTLAFFASLRCR